MGSISSVGFNDIRTRDDLKAKVTWLREISGGRPVRGVKIAAGHTDVHELSRDDLVTTSATVAAFTDLRHV